MSFLGENSSSVICGLRGWYCKSIACNSGSDHTLLGKSELAGWLSDSRVEWMGFQQLRKEGGRG